MALCLSLVYKTGEVVSLRLTTKCMVLLSFASHLCQIKCYCSVADQAQEGVARIIFRVKNVMSFIVSVKQAYIWHGVWDLLKQPGSAYMHFLSF